MARPARPPAEIAAVKAAAAIVRAETGLTAAEPVARIIAARVVAALVADIERNSADELAEALITFEHKMFPSPFNTLATSPSIDLAREFVERRVSRLRSRAGAYLSEGAKCLERQSIIVEINAKLSRRYVRQLRNALR